MMKLYIKIPRVGNLELTKENFSRVYFLCPVCRKEHSREAHDYFAYLVKYGFDLEHQLLCSDCCINYSRYSVDVRLNNPHMTEAEIHSAAMNLAKRSVKGECL